MADLTMKGSPDGTIETKNGIVQCTKKSINALREAVKAGASSCLVAGTLVMGSAPAIAGEPTSAPAISQSSDAENAKLLTDLKARGYSADEISRIKLIMDNSRRFSQELNLGKKPLTTTEFRPAEDTVAGHLAAINSQVANLAKLPSLELKDVIKVDKVTPENITQVLKVIHTPNKEETAIMYGDDRVKAEAYDRTIARQGERWVNNNLPKISPERLSEACTAINAVLANVGHMRLYTIRVEATAVLDRYTPAPDYGPNPTDAQKTVLANRPLNFAQSLAWTTALAKPGTSYRAGVNEILTITIDGISYSLAPESRIKSIPGIPAELKGVTTQAYAQLQAAQTQVIAYNKEMNGLNKSIAESNKTIAQDRATIAQDRATIAQDRATIAQDKATIAEIQQFRFIIRTTDSIREKLLPLLAVYLGADPKKQQEIRDQIVPLADALKQAEVTISKVKPLNEENAREQRNNIATIQELFTLIRKTKVNV